MVFVYRTPGEIVWSTAFRRNFKDRIALLPPKGGTPNAESCSVVCGALHYPFFEVKNFCLTGDE